MIYHLVKFSNFILLMQILRRMVKVASTGSTHPRDQPEAAGVMLNGDFCPACGTKITIELFKKTALAYWTITMLLPLRPKTSGEYISSALAGGTTKRPGVVARAVYVYW
jgi:hypothetical protein